MIPGSDTRVDAYIDALPDWQQVICRRVRELIHAADPDVTETIKRTTQPYFVLEGNVCALLAANIWRGQGCAGARNRSSRPSSGRLDQDKGKV